jgi:hypothetical protein
MTTLSTFNEPLKLHIVSSDVPYPPDYGGMVDVFYKLKTLSEAGVQITLHCFQYGRDEAAALNQYCAKVFYYPRRTGWKGFSLVLPYMMYSRRDKKLLQNLQSDDAPILFEGVHCTYYLDHPALKNRRKLLRNQNLEQEYFALLAKRDKGFFKKLYFLTEARLLRKAEGNLQAADAFLTVAEHDYSFFKEKYPSKIHEYIPSFQANNKVNILEGLGDYCLYHGNLGHPENEEAAIFLLEKVFNKISFPAVLAGKKPSGKLLALAGKIPNVRVIADPDMETMDQLIAEAQIHVLATFQPTGLKLKLLHALFNGRHVVANNNMLKGTGLDAVCIPAGTAEDFIFKIETFKEAPFGPENIARRETLLKQRYDNRENAERIIRLLK